MTSLSLRRVGVQHKQRGHLIDARSMIDGGQTYNETAFLNTSFGYTATRLNLGSLVGQAVKFRFRIARGGSAVPWPFPWVGFGWAIDNVTIYTCEPSPALPSQPTAVTALPGVRRATVSFIPPVSDGEPRLRATRSPRVPAM